MHDRLSRDVFRFWEIRDNISETVRVRDMFCNGRLIGNCMWSIECRSPLPQLWNLNDLEGTLAV